MYWLEEKAQQIQVRDIIIYTVKNMASYENNHIKRSTLDIQPVKWGLGAPSPPYSSC